MLGCLRQACQKLRVRAGGLRIALGWQLGELDGSGYRGEGTIIPIRPMDSWKLLSQLEQRLIDVALMGLMELQGLLGQGLTQLRMKRMALNSMLLCIPICRWDLRLLAAADHPLRECAEVGPDELTLYPSPALPVGMAPQLMGSLQSHGLANYPIGLQHYEEARWEGFAGDGHGLSYAAPHQLKGLQQRYGLVPLEYPLRIQDCVGIVGHRDVLGDGSFQNSCKQLLQRLQADLAPHGPLDGQHWLH